MCVGKSPTNGVFVLILERQFELPVGEIREEFVIFETGGESLPDSLLVTPALRRTDIIEPSAEAITLSRRQQRTRSVCHSFSLASLLLDSIASPETLPPVWASTRRGV